MKPYLSIIIPARDEEDSVRILYNELIPNLKKTKKTFEIIFIDDGSKDKTFDVLKKIGLKDKKVKVIKLRGNFGKSVALQIGFDKSLGQVILTMDADLQDNPNDIHLLVKKLNEGHDLVSGWKKKRRDPILSKVIPSRILNFLTRFFTSIPIHDINSGFKIYRREVIDNLNLYGDLYRYIPVIAHKQNFKVAEVVIDHRPRKFGKSKYGFGRGIKGVIDLVTIVFLTGYLRRPGHFFGVLGLASFFVGFVIGLYIAYLRVITGSIQFRHPLLFLGMLLMIIGVQLFSTGLIAEMIIYTRQKLNYQTAIKEG